MPNLQKIYRTLRSVRDPEVDAAMAQALPTADRAARRLIVLSLLERGSEVGLLAIVRHFARLESDLQQIVTDQAASLDAALRSASLDGVAETRLNAIDIVVRSGGYRLAYLVSAQLHDGDARLTRAAAAALLSMARSVAFDRRAAGSAVRRVSWIASAVIEACSCYHQHRRQDVLLAAAALAPRRFDRLTEYLTNRRAAAHLGMTEMIRRADRPLINRAMLAFASIGELESAVLEALRSQQIARHLPDLLELGHLLAAPAIGAAVRKITQAQHLLPTAGAIRTLRPNRLYQCPRWIAQLHLPTEQRAAGFAEVTASDDRFARLLGLRALMNQSDEAALAVVAASCLDADGVVARIALRYLMLRRWSGLPALMMRLVTSPHEGVRRIVEHQISPTGFDRFWDHWERMAPAHRIAAGKALMKVDAAFHRKLADRMAIPDADTRLKAVMLVRALGQETYFERSLLALAHDESDRVSSAAVQALGRLGDSPQVAATLRDKLRAADDRVRANAVEAVEQAGHTDACAELLRQMADESGNRSRANAIKTLLTRPVGEAMPALGRMLADTDARHRLSALWVVEQLTVADVARRVAALARQDPDPRVRRRAIDVFRHIAEQHMRQQADAESEAAPAGDGVREGAA